MVNKIEIGDGEDAVRVVCIPVTEPLAFPDNLISTCCKCGIAIQHRPNVPKGPPKICFACALDAFFDMEREPDAGELNMTITPESAKEFGDYIRKKRLH